LNHQKILLKATIDEKLAREVLGKNLTEKYKLSSRNTKVSTSGRELTTTNQEK
jgi:hypothetical protein